MKRLTQKLMKGRAAPLGVGGRTVQLRERRAGTGIAKMLSLAALVLTPALAMAKPDLKIHMTA
ncbi:MAG TPA: hypothetical protein VJ998_01975, partial [Pseudomonadales bacterium]|nr:hypothetical protein [Pseudomonadales bacterium]